MRNVLLSVNVLRYYSLEIFELTKKYLTKKEGLERMQKYCAIQERCHQEVYNKLRSLHLGHDDSNQIIAELISDGFLNEVRYAKAFAQGKFRMNKWGRIKIKSAMKQKNVAVKCIELGLAVIEEEEYHNK